MDFTPRFKGILDSLKRHSDLLDHEAVSLDIIESHNLRTKLQDDIDQKERDRASSQLQETLAWLSIQDRLQEDDLDALYQRKAPGTGEWIFQNPKFKKWAKDKTNGAILWIQGIPGSGMFGPILVILNCP